VDSQFVRPDIQYVPNAERHRLTERGAEGRPGLVVEILSPASGRIDKITKPARYADFGIPEYWVVDPDFARHLTPRACVRLRCYIALHTP
jgi:Uma2 family endonuclease